MLQCTGKCWFREIEIAGSPVRRENFFTSSGGEVAAEVFVAVVRGAGDV